MQKLLVLTGSHPSDASEQIIALAERLGYRLVASAEVESDENRMFDPTPLAQVATLPKGRRFYLDPVRDMGLGDVQQMTILDAWKLLGGCLRAESRGRPFVGGTMFREVSAAMVARGLRFADQAPIWPFYTSKQWRTEFGLASHIASALAANQVPGPSLLRKFTDNDVDIHLDRAREPTRGAIAELRDRIRTTH